METSKMCFLRSKHDMVFGLLPSNKDSNGCRNPEMLEHRQEGVPVLKETN